MSDEKPESSANDQDEAASKSADLEQESMIERARQRAQTQAAAARDEAEEAAPELAEAAEAADSEKTAADSAADAPGLDVDDAEHDAREERSASADAAESAPAVPPAPKASGGRGLAFLSLLLALGAAGGAGYIYYELIYNKPYQAQFAAVDDRVQALVRSATQEGAQKTSALAEQLATDLDGLRSEFRALRGEQSDTIDTAIAEQQSRLESTEQSLIESLNRVANQAPPTQEEWKVAELEYLLRIANHRVLMEKDADGALRLLQTADAMLAELDDFGMHEVRAQLAEEILSLKRLGQNDVQGLFLRLEAVKRNLSGLPLDVPEYLQAAPAESVAIAEEEAGQRSPLAALAEAMGTYFKVRELRTELKPLLAPEEVTYLEMNLRLMVEQAQLAALRGEADIFEQSIDNAIDWLNDHLDAQAPEVSALVSELTAVRQISVVREMPDITGSLRALIATERGAS
jgi:uroporphyrin-3 C-methyltransferase